MELTPMAPPRTSFSPHRRYQAALNLVVGVIALGVCLAWINFFAMDRLRSRHDWSGGDRFAISPLTRQVLASLTNDVKVTILFSRETPLFSYVDGLLRQYALVQPRIKLRAIDYNTEPNTAMLLKATYQLTANAENVILFDNGILPPQIISEGELSTYDADIGELMAGRQKEVRRAGFKGEVLFTSAIAMLGEARPARAFFLQGHGEHRMDGEDDIFGYRRFSQLLTTKGVSASPLRLTQDGSIPQDCELLIIAGPEQPFTPSEISQIQQYLENGGRILLLLHPYRPQLRLGIEDLLQSWGIATPPWYAGDQDTGESGFRNMVTGNFGQHPITTPLSRSEGRITFLMPRVVGRLPAEILSPDSPRAVVLVATGTNGMTLSDLRDNAVAFRPGVDRVGEIPLAAAAEKGGVAGVTLSRGNGRLVVIGDSSMLGNKILSFYSNATFAELTVAWLLDRTQLLAIGPKPLPEYRIDLGETQSRTLRWMLLAVLPGGVLLLGVVVWFHRRS